MQSACDGKTNVQISLLYPDRPQREKLQATLEVCRELYNAALQERREAWSSHRRGIHYVEQANQLPDIKAVREDVRAAQSGSARCAAPYRQNIQGILSSLPAWTGTGGFLAFAPRVLVAE